MLKQQINTNMPKARSVAALLKFPHFATNILNIKSTWNSTLNIIVLKLWLRKCKNLGTLWAYSETVFVFGCMRVCLQATCDVDFTHRWNRIIVLLVTLVLLIYIYLLLLFKIFLFDTCIYSLYFARKYYNYKNWKLNGLIK